MKIKKFMVVFAAALFLPVAIATADVSDNLYWGQVTDVYDGDSLTAEIALWPGHYVQAKVRIRGIDAPEIRGKCEAERQQARLARDFLKQAILGQKIMLSDVAREKYGRILASVSKADGKSVSEMMADEGLARRYQGKTRQSWCL